MILLYMYSHRSAKNMSYQNMTNERGTLNQLGTIKGIDLIGKLYQHHYVLMNLYYYYHY